MDQVGIAKKKFLIYQVGFEKNPWQEPRNGSGRVGMNDIEAFRSALHLKLVSTASDPQAMMAFNQGSGLSVTYREAYQYALEQPGKYVRPSLVYLACLALGGTWEQAMLPSLAIEMIHTYSLIHDDLPCMDDDGYRRGRPTLHRAYDEATALLVGDGLLTDSFRLICKGPAPLLAEQRLAMVDLLSEACGSRGMVYGQAADLYWTGRTGADQTILEDIHHNKTGKLIAAACGLGAIAAAAYDKVSAIMAFGATIGLCFQLIDDCLDGREGTGKSVGKDLQSEKLTFLSFMTENQALAYADELTQSAIAELEANGIKGELIERYVRDLLERSH